MKISVKTIKSINAKCKRGFLFDIQNYRQMSGKALCKVIVLEDNKKAIKVTLDWTDEIIYVKNKCQCTVPQYTGNLFPELNVCVLRKADASGCWVGGMGKFYAFKKLPSTKKQVNKLCEVTELVTDELLCSLLPERECKEYMSKSGEENPVK